MSNVDELERLFKLKESGALSEEQYKKQVDAVLAGKKQEKPKKSWRWRWWNWALAIVLVVVWVGYVTESDRVTVAKTVPECASPDSKASVKYTFDEAPYAKEAHVTAVTITKAVQISYDAEKRVRECAALLTMSNGAEEGITFRMFFDAEGNRLIQLDASD